MTNSAVEFQSTLPARGATQNRYVLPRHDGHFNPRSPHGERLTPGALSMLQKAFQSTLPARGATLHFAIPSRPQAHFNPRSPHGERRFALSKNSTSCAFQSTPPARGATVSRCPKTQHPAHFNPRSPHGERPTLCRSPLLRRHFNPRSPHGERLAADADVRHFAHISIHAPRTGSDPISSQKSSKCTDFNPRSPHGERRGCFVGMSFTTQFQSTLPARGATRPVRLLVVVDDISIHAPRTGSDDDPFDMVERIEISIHAPRTGSDTFPLAYPRQIPISIHAPRTGSDSAK